MVDGRLNFGGRLAHAQRHVGPAIDRRQQIGGGRGRARRQQVAFGEQRARLRHRSRAAGGDEHPRQPRVQRHPAHSIADLLLLAAALLAFAWAIAAVRDEWRVASLWVAGVIDDAQIGVTDDTLYRLARLWPDHPALYVILIILIWCHGCLGRGREN